MQNTTFDIDVSGDFVHDAELMNLFKITGPGSLQGSDAADALIAALSDPRNGDDTYTEIPFQVTDAGSPIASGTTLPQPLRSKVRPSLPCFRLP